VHRIRLIGVLHIFCRKDGSHLFLAREFALLGLYCGEGSFGQQSRLGDCGSLGLGGIFLSAVVF